MNVSSIFGGPRKKGNTATILGWVEKELRVLGHQLERINLSTKKVTDCSNYIYIWDVITQKIERSGKNGEY